MNFEFHPDAEIEFNKAIDYYERIETGLGYDFAIEVYDTIQRSVSLPKAWSVIDSDIRRSLVKRFPYGVLYSAEKNGIYIVAVMHLHRLPCYWIVAIFLDSLPRTQLKKVFPKNGIRVMQIMVI